MKKLSITALILSIVALAAAIFSLVYKNAQEDTANQFDQTSVDDTVSQNDSGLSGSQENGTAIPTNNGTDNNLTATSSGQIQTTDNANSKTYSDQLTGLSFNYPASWRATRMQSTEETSCNNPNIVDFVNTAQTIDVSVGIRLKGDIDTRIFCRTGMPAGEFVDRGLVDGLSPANPVHRFDLVYLGKTQLSQYLKSAKQYTVTVGRYELDLTIDYVGSDMISKDNIDLDLVSLPDFADADQIAKNVLKAAE